MDTSWIRTAKRLESGLAEYRSLKIWHAEDDKLAAMKTQLDRRYAQMAAFALGLPDADISFDCDLESMAEQCIGAEGLRSVFGPLAVSSLPPYISAELIDYAEKLTDRSIAIGVSNMPDPVDKGGQLMYISARSPMFADHLLQKYARRTLPSDGVFQDAQRLAEDFASRNGAAHIQTVERRIGCRFRVGATQSKYDLETRSADSLPSYCHIK
jgi:hypothetical protein